MAEVRAAGRVGHPLRQPVRWGGIRVSAAIALLAFSLASLTFTGNAGAALPVGDAPAAPGLSPIAAGPHGYFEYTLSPGQSAEPTLTVHDLADAPARYLLYTASASTSPVSGVAYGQPNRKQHGVAAWLSPTLRSISLPPGQAIKQSFHVRVPAGTAPGDYVAALVAGTPARVGNARAIAGSRRVGFLLTTRTIVAVVVHVPGPTAAAARFGAPKVSVQQQRRQLIEIPIHDTGNVLMKPYLTSKLTQCSSGKPLLKLARQLDTFVPHTSIDYPWYLPGGQTLAIGCYQIELSLYESRDGKLLASYHGRLQVGTRNVPTITGQRRRAHAFPWWIIALAVAFGLLAITAVLLVRARRERRRLLKRLDEQQR